MNRTSSDRPSSQHRSKKGWIYATAAGLLLCITLLPWLRAHLFSPNIWFDESGQYWLSLGLHHSTPPLSTPGGWNKIVEYGRVMNSDPGTYTLMLRAWINLFGSDIATLRTLSLIFFLLGPLVIWLAGRRLKIPPSARALAALAPCGSVMFFHYATEIRAYSMEALAVWYFFFLAAWTEREERTSRLVLLGTIGALLVGARYSTYLYGAAACLVLCIPLRPVGLFFKRSLLVAAPVTALVAAGFMIFGRYQAGGTQRAPGYVEPFLLQGKDSSFILQQLKQNFFVAEAWPLTVFLLLAPAYFILTRAELTRFRTFVMQAWLFVVIAVLFVIGASVIGKLPWAIYTRWSIGYQALSAACLATLIMMTAASGRTLAPARLQKPIGAAAFSLALVLWGVHVHHVQKQPRPYYETVGSMLEQLARRNDKAELRFWVTGHASASIRYLCEVGPLKGAFTYPSNFHFETPNELKDSTAIAVDSVDVVILHNQSLLPAYQSRITGSDKKPLSSTIVLPPPSALILLEPQEMAATAP
ncbi:MAG: hypothetical protein RLZZ303_3280 [Candidatus Hydrogenedentota bacterium]